MDTQTVRSFQKQINALNAALSACGGSQEEEPVHRLRTATRRMEAQLSLLKMLKVLPSHSKYVSEVRSRLKKVRRAAGTVRDLDVQIELIHQDDRAADELHEVSDKMRQALKQLRRYLQKERKHEAPRLAKVLEKEGEGLTLSLQNLRSALKPTKENRTTQKELIARIERSFRAKTRQSRQVVRISSSTASQPVDVDMLHAWRKEAKLCRYMVESLGGRSGATKQLAERFEAIQEAGGHWHDWLMLEDVAAKHTEKRGKLAKRYAGCRDADLAEYLRRLADMRAKGARATH